MVTVELTARKLGSIRFGVVVTYFLCSELISRMLMRQNSGSRFRDSLQGDVFRIGASLLFICVSNNLFVLSETEY